MVTNIYGRYNWTNLDDIAFICETKDLEYKHSHVTNLFQA